MPRRRKQLGIELESDDDVRTIVTCYFDDLQQRLKMLGVCATNIAVVVNVNGKCGASIYLSKEVEAKQAAVSLRQSKGAMEDMVDELIADMGLETKFDA